MIHEIYASRGIKLNTIVDQVNNLYNIEFPERMNYMKNWRAMRLNYGPMVMVSSKNNPYLSSFKDPVKYVAASDNLQNYHPINMDNHISAEARLAYTWECLLFELQKNKV